MFGNLSGPTLLVILFIVLLLFGAPKLPGLAKSLGQSMRILKKEVRSDSSEGEGGAAAGDAPAAGSSDGAAGSTGSAGSTPPKKPSDGDVS